LIFAETREDFDEILVAKTPLKSDKWAGEDEDLDVKVLPLVLHSILKLGLPLFYDIFRKTGMTKTKLAM
jgi:hypothetical protein